MELFPSRRSVIRVNQCCYNNSHQHRSSKDWTKNCVSFLLWIEEIVTSCGGHVIVSTLSVSLGINEICDRGFNYLPIMVGTISTIRRTVLSRFSYAYYSFGDETTENILSRSPLLLKKRLLIRENPSTHRDTWSCVCWQNDDVLLVVLKEWQKSKRGTIKQIIKMWIETIISWSGFGGREKKGMTPIPLSFQGEITGAG